MLIRESPMTSKELRSRRLAAAGVVIKVRWGFPDSTHLIVENGGHETLPSAEVQAVVVDFFKGADVRGRAVSFARPAFLSVEEAKAQAPRRR
jgi:hypothetical protein